MRGRGALHQRRQADAHEAPVGSRVTLTIAPAVVVELGQQLIKLRCERTHVDARAAGCDPSRPFDDHLRDALLHALCGAGSNLVVLPVPDIFGWRDRINTPGVVDEINWTWRMPVDDLIVEQVPRERASFLWELSANCGRDVR